MSQGLGKLVFVNENMTSHLFLSHGTSKVQLSDGATLSTGHGLAWLHDAFCTLEYMIYNAEECQITKQAYTYWYVPFFGINKGILKLDITGLCSLHHFECTAKPG